MEKQYLTQTLPFSFLVVNGKWIIFMHMIRLTEIGIQNALLSLEGWKMEKDGIIKSFVFKNFKDALATMNRIGEVAEEMNHHPEWFNVYNKLDIRLSTHDIGGITQLDIDLATAIEEIVKG